MHLCRCDACRREIAKIARRASHRMLKRELDRVRRDQLELGQASPAEDDFDFLDDDDDDEEE